MADLNVWEMNICLSHHGILNTHVLIWKTKLVTDLYLNGT